MIVPFLFSLDEYSKEYPTHLWIFYKFMDFAKKYDYPIIAQEKYFKEYPEHGASKEFNIKKFKYLLPSNEQLDLNKKYCISEEEENKIIKNKNVDDFWLDILKNDNSQLQKIIEEKIKLIEKNNVKIDAIITWIWFPALEKACNKNNIKLIQYELSTIRENEFNTTLGYFQFCNKYESKYAKDDYEVFKKSEKMIFDREELLSMFLTDDNLYRIKYMYSVPKYRVGYALGMDKDKFEMAFTKMNNEEIFKKIKEKYSSSDVLIRSHPASKYDVSKTGFTIDDSSSAAEWISKCQKIICNISNVAYEAMLYGKDVINVNDVLPTAFDDYSDLKFFDEKKIGLEKLNFLTFYCYCPYELMFDKEYIEYRLSNPSVIDIYNYHLKYILEQKKLSYDKILRMKQIERIGYILKTVHHLDENQINEIRRYSLTYTIEKMENEIKKKNREITNLNNKIIQIDTEKNTYKQAYLDIFSSTSWKLTKPLRATMDLIKKIFRRKGKKNETKEK